VQDLGRFLNAKSSEEPQFDDIAFTGIHCGEFRQRLIQLDENVRLGGLQKAFFVECGFRDSSTAFGLKAAPGDIDQDSPHQSRSHCEKVRSALPLDVFPLDQPDVRFINKRRRLQGVIPALLRHV
jgi:hypothetical protein